MAKYTGKTAVITAASSGIGKGIASVLAGEGCDLHLLSRNREKLNAVAEEISRASGTDVKAHSADMSVPGDVNRFIGEVSSEGRKIDFLVLNYGDPKIAPFLSLTEEDWDKATNLILRSSVTIVRKFLPEIIESRGRVIFVTSLTTKQPMVNFALSSALRSAVVSLSKVLSLEHAKSGITVNSISQGFFMTPRLESVAARKAEEESISLDTAYGELMEAIPARRFGSTEEIGKLVSFLCSDEAGYINGANIPIDGGFSGFPF